ncbi:hypothetical protein Sango_1252500 [Sesamum angolense]|uniref:Uncharacterized protein n=1 Tax=Sesamum angolense TaxID=2727404 RepID=A0AAE1WQQ9_9LAMI|nr:hypothetical protein Sango_1252500 [Sesamum angolense]
MNSGIFVLGDFNATHDMSENRTPPQPTAIRVYLKASSLSNVTARPKSNGTKGKTSVHGSSLEKWRGRELLNAFFRSPRLKDREEVKEAFFDIAEDKSPRPDGYSSGFFKGAWSIIVTVADFRPISCCNVLYKWKSQFILSKLAQGDRDTLLQVLDFQEGYLPVRYLGLPLLSSRLKISDCQPLFQRVENKIKEWEGLQLSFAARVQLIKSVIKAFNIYWESAFIFLKGVIRRIEKMMRNFLWKDSSQIVYTKVAWSQV